MRITVSSSDGKITCNYAEDMSEHVAYPLHLKPVSTAEYYEPRQVGPRTDEFYGMQVTL